MKATIIILAGLFLASFGFAQTPTTTTTTTDAATMDMKHVEMHEKMSKAHQDAADCLKSGKPHEECQKAFHSMCKDSGGGAHCKMGGDMRGKMKYKK